jgi:hypothetical protein
VILSAFFVVTQLVTETSRLPAFLRTVKLPFGHPIAIAVCVWVGIDLIRRLRRGTPLDAETDEPAFGDAFEARGEPALQPLVVPDDEPIVDESVLADPIVIELTPGVVESTPADPQEPAALTS